MGMDRNTSMLRPSVKVDLSDYCSIAKEVHDGNVSFLETI